MRPNVHPTCPSHKLHVHLIRKYLNIFEHIGVYRGIFKNYLENMSSMIKRKKDMSAPLSRPFRASSLLQMPIMTTLYNCISYN
jgi:hypothetical protein